LQRVPADEGNAEICGTACVRGRPTPAGMDSHATRSADFVCGHSLQTDFGRFGRHVIRVTDFGRPDDTSSGQRSSEDSDNTSCGKRTSKDRTTRHLVNGLQTTRTTRHLVNGLRTTRTTRQPANGLRKTWMTRRPSNGLRKIRTTRSPTVRPLVDLSWTGIRSPCATSARRWRQRRNLRNSLRGGRLAVFRLDSHATRSADYVCGHSLQTDFGRFGQHVIRQTGSGRPGQHVIRPTDSAHPVGLAQSPTRQK
jgi:hypothetical protein